MVFEDGDSAAGGDNAVGREVGCEELEAGGEDWLLDEFWRREAFCASEDV